MYSQLHLFRSAQDIATNGSYNTGYVRNDAGELSLCDECKMNA